MPTSTITDPATNPTFFPLLPLHTAHDMIHATRYTLHATRYMLHATRYTLHATCCLIIATCHVQNPPRWEHVSSPLESHDRTNRGRPDRPGLTRAGPRNSLSPARSGNSQHSRQAQTHKPRDSYRSPRPAGGPPEHSQFFPNGAGPSNHGPSACAICLGRYRHAINKCNAEHFWDGAKARCSRNQSGRIVNPSGNILCSNWQRPEGCRSTSHDTRHECSGCGKADHGAQQCPRAQKEPSTHSLPT
jgi:hypothetical protein